MFWSTVIILAAWLSCVNGQAVPVQVSDYVLNHQPGSSTSLCNPWACAKGCHTSSCQPCIPMCSPCSNCPRGSTPTANDKSNSLTPDHNLKNHSQLENGEKLFSGTTETNVDNTPNFTEDQTNTNHSPISDTSTLRNAELSADINISNHSTTTSTTTNQPLTTMQPEDPNPQLFVTLKPSDGNGTWNMSLKVLASINGGEPVELKHETVINILPCNQSYVKPPCCCAQGYLLNPNASCVLPKPCSNSKNADQRLSTQTLAVTTAPSNVNTIINDSSMDRHGIDSGNDSGSKASTDGKPLSYNNVDENPIQVTDTTPVLSQSEPFKMDLNFPKIVNETDRNVSPGINLTVEASSTVSSISDTQASSTNTNLASSKLPVTASSVDDKINDIRTEAPAVTDNQIESPGNGKSMLDNNTDANFIPVNATTTSTGPDNAPDFKADGTVDKSYQNKISDSLPHTSNIERNYTSQEAKTMTSSGDIQEQTTHINTATSAAVPISNVSPDENGKNDMETHASTHENPTNKFSGDGNEGLLNETYKTSTQKDTSGSSSPQNMTPISTNNKTIVQHNDTNISGIGSEIPPVSATESPMKMSTTSSSVSETKTLPIQTTESSRTVSPITSSGNKSVTTEVPSINRTINDSSKDERQTSLDAANKSPAQVNTPAPSGSKNITDTSTNNKTIVQHNETNVSGTGSEMSAAQSSQSPMEIASIVSSVSEAPTSSTQTNNFVHTAASITSPGNKPVTTEAPPINRTMNDSSKDGNQESLDAAKKTPAQIDTSVSSIPQNTTYTSTNNKTIVQHNETNISGTGSEIPPVQTSESSVKVSTTSSSVNETQALPIQTNESTQTASLITSPGNQPVTTEVPSINRTINDSSKDEHQASLDAANNTPNQIATPAPSGSQNTTYTSTNNKTTVQHNETKISGTGTEIPPVQTTESPMKVNTTSSSVGETQILPVQTTESSRTVSPITSSENKPVTTAAPPINRTMNDSSKDVNQESLDAAKKTPAQIDTSASSIPQNTTYTSTNNKTIVQHNETNISRTGSEIPPVQTTESSMKVNTTSSSVSETQTLPVQTTESSRTVSPITSSENKPVTTAVPPINRTMNDSSKDGNQESLDAAKKTPAQIDTSVSSIPQNTTYTSTNNKTIVQHNETNISRTGSEIPAVQTTESSMKVNTTSSSSGETPTSTIQTNDIVHTVSPITSSGNKPVTTEILSIDKHINDSTKDGNEVLFNTNKTPVQLDTPASSIPQNITNFSLNSTTIAEHNETKIYRNGSEISTVQTTESSVEVSSTVFPVTEAQSVLFKTNAHIDKNISIRTEPEEPIFNNSMSELHNSAMSEIQTSSMNKTIKATAPAPAPTIGNLPGKLSEDDEQDIDPQNLFLEELQPNAQPQKRNIFQFSKFYLNQLKKFVEGDEDSPFI
ncbi:serine-rich adhesin for platelets-like isoform X2 [Diachasmimorpha longicaudata]|uniref:serine-rich adhesin for platelets-like isoform X2 n=1 Tax=Diachasmimorpha longicaudata TaxID=58733 RepID=UPI0030B8B695